MSKIREDFFKEFERGVILTNETKYLEAKQVFDALLETVPHISQTLVQRGRINWEMVNWEAALADFRAASLMNPNDRDVLWTISLLLLQMGKFDEGWENLGVRWESSRFDSARLHTTKPEWKIGDKYKHLLVWSEQGIGDQIIYSSLLRELKTHGDKLTVMADARLIPLLERGMPDIDFVPQTARLKGLDYHLPIGSLPAQFIHNYDDIKTCTAQKYIKTDPARVEKLRAKINKKPDEFVIGLSWDSGAKVIGNHKSIELDDLMPMFDLPSTRVVSLQYGQPYGPINDLEKRTGKRIECIHEVHNTHDLDGLAALMECCDVIVTVSNATAHLAGALGFPVLLLNSNKLWFWAHTENGRSLWYPSVKVFNRRNAISPWTPQVEAITTEIKLMRGMDVSKPTFVFFHVGQDVSQPQKLVDSIVQTNPGAEIVMCTDMMTPFVRGVTQRVNVQGDRNKLMQFRLDAFAKARLNNPAIYLDTDMVVQEKINPTELLESFNVMMCRRSFQRDAGFNINLRGMNFSEYRGKTLDQVYPYLACATITRNHEPWDSMAMMLRVMDPKYSVWYGDQEALKAYATSEKIGTLDESEYACLPEKVNRNFPPKIIHYKGNRK